MRFFSVCTSHWVCLIYLRLFCIIWVAPPPSECYACWEGFTTLTLQHMHLKFKVQMQNGISTKREVHRNNCTTKQALKYAENRNAVAT